MARLVFVLTILVALGACSPLPKESIPLTGDFSPPALLSMKVQDGSCLALSFDEDIKALAGSYALEPARGETEARAEGKELTLHFGTGTELGQAYRLAGEVEDLRGNTSRFVLEFTGYNARPPALRLNEVRTQKNSSTKTPHRDYVEIEVLEGGNLGGVELSWISSTKLLSWRFPAAEVEKGGIVLLHLAPEAKASEVDETGSDLGLSGGMDALPAARDFWIGLGPLPDASGAIVLRERPAGRALDGLFYSDEAKEGPLPEGRLRDLVSILGTEGILKLGGEQAGWEDGFRWKPSASRSMVRKAEGSWELCASGAESPGLPNP